MWRIVDDPEARCGVTVDKLINIAPLPKADPATGVPEGMYLLQRLPVGIIKPVPFYQGARGDLEKLVKTMQQTYSRVSPQVVDQWTAFLAEAPDTDDAEDWVARHPLRIPLLNSLFSGTAPVAQPAAAATQ